jgi:hypothetical protein
MAMKGVLIVAIVAALYAFAFDADSRALSCLGSARLFHENQRCGTLSVLCWGKQRAAKADLLSDDACCSKLVFPLALALAVMPCAMLCSRPATRAALFPLAFLLAVLAFLLRHALLELLLLCAEARFPSGTNPKL